MANKTNETKGLPGYETVLIGKAGGCPSPMSPVTLDVLDEYGVKLDSWGPRTAQDKVPTEAALDLFNHIENPEGTDLPGIHSAKNDLANWIGWKTPDQLMAAFLLLDHGSGLRSSRCRFLAALRFVSGDAAALAFEASLPWVQAHEVIALKAKLQTQEQLCSGFRSDARNLTRALKESTEEKNVLRAQVDTFRLAQGDAERDLVGANERIEVLVAALSCIGRLVDAGDLDGLRSALSLARASVVAEQVRSERKGE